MSPRSVSPTVSGILYFMIKGHIYKITSPTGRVYIGQTIDLKLRLYCYVNFERIKGQKKLYNSIVKYGWEAHKFDIIREVESYTRSGIDSILDSLEIYYIRMYKSNHYEHPNIRGMNLTKGGKNGSAGHIWTDEMRKNQSIAQLRAYKEGRKTCHWVGVKPVMAEETIEKIRLANIGRVMKEEDYSMKYKPVICVNTGVIYKSISDAARCNNKRIAMVSRVANGKAKHTGGLVFKFYK